MSFITQGKTNWKFLLIVVILAAIVGGGALWFKEQHKTETVQPIQLPKIEGPEETTEAECNSIHDLLEQAKCFTDLAKETKDESYCEKIEIPEAPEIISNCYSELAILKNNPYICWKVETASLSSSCWEYFGMKDWQTYRNEEYGFEIKYPKDFTEQKVESEETLLSITKDDSYYFGISVRKKYNINQITSSIKEAKEVMVEDHSGYEYFYVEGAGASEVLLIQVGQDALNISLDYIDDKRFPNAEDKKDYVQSIFNQMLSTFRFIEEKPYLKVLSPNGGEKWTKGKNYTIQWDQKGLEIWGNEATICLEGFDTEDNVIFAKEEWRHIPCAWESGGDSTPYLIAAKATLNEEKYSWDIPEDIFERFEKPPTFFKITLRVFDALPSEGRTEWAGQIERDESDNYFNITE